MEITLNGKPFQPDEFERSLLDAIRHSAKAHLHESFASLRNPSTGEFPTVRVFGDSIDDLRASIEGTQELLAVVSERLNSDERKVATLMPIVPIGSPRVFLSYSFEDQALAERIARRLMGSGIMTWWAEWEIGAGDSLRQKIDEGL